MRKISELEKAFMFRDNLSEEDAQKYVDSLIKLVDEGEDPEELLHEEGFEPDYVFDLINF